MNVAAADSLSISTRPRLPLLLVLFAAALSASGCTLLESPDDHFAEPDTSATMDTTTDTMQASELCQEYCGQFLNLCAADPANTYTDEADCLTQCGTLPEGVVTDYARNSVRCRMNHFGASISDPGTHCPHASFSGGDQCVGTEVSPCEAYCGLLSENCPQDFEALDTPDNDLSATAMCVKMCGTFLPAPVGADDELFTTDTIECRMNFLDRMTAPNQPGVYCRAADSGDMAQGCRGAIPVVETTCQAFCMIAFNECPGVLPYVDLPACQADCATLSLETATCALDLLIDTDSGQPECGSLDPISEACGEETCEQGAACGDGCIMADGTAVDPNFCACGAGTVDCSGVEPACLGGSNGTVANPGEIAEVCANSIDDDCDGEIDEADCTAP